MKFICIKSTAFNFSGEFVTTATATDADEERTLHTKIAYSIVKQHPENMFFINQETGGIHVKHNTLDREVCNSFSLNHSIDRIISNFVL